MAKSNQFAVIKPELRNRDSILAAKGVTPKVRKPVVPRSV